ncbi:hypothetical protein A5740_23725 [Mycobacterium sp. GA-1841]|uniref:hypothetical protein n=1 Tax=Mycobacterium sp. GA-1841 TaxID=1834154 RepID=UPI00096C78AC|nr:hypothetical protein [Mycobacterium sp. GA-1841]OMC40779.1 hypothetical protein A5740_23725 [Mycobacterium sp. GA-1841]
MTAAHRAAVLGRRTCAGLAACSAALHVVVLTHTVNPVAWTVLAVMIVGCLFCARDLWQRGSPGVWCAVALMNLAMVAVHTPMPAHQHRAGPVTAAAPSTVMTATMLLALVEVVIAGIVLCYCTRNRSQIECHADPGLQHGLVDG